MDEGEYPKAASDAKQKIEKHVENIEKALHNEEYFIKQGMNEGQEIQK